MTEPEESQSLLQWLEPLTDAVRLRLLYLVDAHELSVGELASSLQLPQSTISRHLKRLLDAGWVVRRSEGTASLYRRASARLDHVARQLWALAEQECSGDPVCMEDAHRAGEVIAARKVDSRNFFGAVGGAWTELRRELFGRSLEHEPLLALLDPEWTIADLGCGTGASAAELAVWVKAVEAIDREAAMLDAARRRLSAYDNVHFHQADLQAIPLEDASVDAVLISLVLHHIESPLDIVRESLRIVRPGGPVLIIDMVEHQREAYRDTMGHVHLGFSDEDVRNWAKACGCQTAGVQRLRSDAGSTGPALFVARLSSH